MRHQIVLSGCIALFVPVLGLAAETEALDSFVLEMTMPAPSQSASTIAVHCQTGCVWTEETIECSAQQPCHAIIASSSVVDSVDKLQRHKVEARPIAGSVCIGLPTKSDPPPFEHFQRCQETTDARGNPTQMCESEEVPTPDTRVVVTAVMAGSPAEQAGFRAGDVVATLNAVPMRVRMDVYHAILSKAPGQSFEALLVRAGGSVVVRGHFGIAMSDDRCAVADEATLRNPALTAQELGPAPFLVTLDGLVSGVEVHCVQGCGWAVGPIHTSEPVHLSGTFDQNDMVSLHDVGDAPRPPAHWLRHSSSE